MGARLRFKASAIVVVLNCAVKLQRRGEASGGDSAGTSRRAWSVTESATDASASCPGVCDDGDVNPDEPIEIGPGVFKRVGDCASGELESAIRLIAQTRIDRAWIDEQADGPDQGELTVGRRFFANTTQAERDLIAYWQMVKLAGDERARSTRTARSPTSARLSAATGIDVMASKKLIDQALATVAAAQSLGPGDQISLTREQALVWAIYLRVLERHRGLASGAEIDHSVRAASESGIPDQEIEAAMAAADRPGASDEK